MLTAHCQLVQEKVEDGMIVLIKGSSWKSRFNNCLYLGLVAVHEDRFENSFKVGHVA